MENISVGLLLMAVGMTTVFAILFLVIYLGKGLIAFVNKYIPEEVAVKQQVAVQTATVASNASGISNQETAAIVSAISVLTGGKGKVTKIEKK